jgi:hypothetical protein
VIIIEGVQNVHGKCDVWLLHITTKDSKMVGFVTGWYAVGQLLGYVHINQPVELLMNVDFYL